MKKTNPFIYCLVSLLVPINIIAQNGPTFTSPKQVRIHKPFVDASIGGVLVPGEGIGLNMHLGVGYQLKPFLGFGVGTTFASDISDYSPKSFSGIGLEYRIDYKKVFFKNTVGLVLKEDYDSDDAQIRLERIAGNNYYFYRGALGYKPANGLINVGIVLHYTRGNYQRLFCEENCIPDGLTTRTIFNPQFYFGLSFPKYK